MKQHIFYFYCKVDNLKLSKYDGINTTEDKNNVIQTYILIITRFTVSNTLKMPDNSRIYPNIAYKDPIGSTTPHIKIQIKYRQDTKATSQELRQLKGNLTTNDIGVFISISGFASDALKEFKPSSPHIELIDLERFIELWQEFYEKMKDEDKALMPISPVYFVDKD